MYATKWSVSIKLATKWQNNCEVKKQVLITYNNLIIMIQPHNWDKYSTVTAKQQSN